MNKAHHTVTLPITDYEELVVVKDNSVSKTELGQLVVLLNAIARTVDRRLHSSLEQILEQSFSPNFLKKYRELSDKLGPQTDNLHQTLIRAIQTDFK